MRVVRRRAESYWGHTSVLLAFLAVIGGLVLLVWSADRFVDGAAATANHLSVPPLLIGMVIVGFGTSAPEMVVSAIAASQGNPGLALGNAYGSNIANIGLVVGLVALLRPLSASGSLVRVDTPVMVAVCLVFVWACYDGMLGRVDGGILVSDRNGNSERVNSLSMSAWS